MNELEELMRSAASFSEDEGGAEIQPQSKPEPVQTQKIIQYAKEEVKIPTPIEEEPQRKPYLFNKTSAKVTPNSVISADTKDIIIKSISVYEDFLSLEERDKRTLSDFLDVSLDNSPELIEAIMVFDKDKLKTLELFVKLLSMTNVKRAFLIMSLSNEDLTSVGKMTEDFNPNHKTTKDVSDKMEFGEELEEGIEGISSQAIPYLENLKNILRKGNLNG